MFQMQGPRAVHVFRSDQCTENVSIIYCVEKSHNIVLHLKCKGYWLIGCVLTRLCAAIGSVCNIDALGCVDAALCCVCNIDDTESINWSKTRSMPAILQF